MRIGKIGLCLALALSLAGFGYGDGTWTDAENGVTFNYTVSDGEASVSIASCGVSASVVIPSEIEGYKVTSIAGRLSPDVRTNLVSVVVPLNVPCSNVKRRIKYEKITLRFVFLIFLL